MKDAQYPPAVCGPHPDSFVLRTGAGNSFLELEVHVHLKDILGF